LRWKSKKLYLHSILAGIMAYLFAGIWEAAWLAFVVMITHALIDGFRCSKNGELFSSNSSRVI